MKAFMSVVALTLICLFATTSFASESSDLETTHTDSKIYWSAVFGPKVRRASTDGSNVEVVISDFGANGIAVDAENGKIYWSDHFWLDIRRTNLDGTSTEILVPNGTVSNPRQISLDVAAGKMYWTDEFHPIRRANLDGSEIENLINTGASPSALELDIERKQIYWVDGFWKNIRRANLDGSNIEDLVTNIFQFVSGLSLDLPGGKMYWTDLNFDGLFRANLDGTQVEAVISELPDGTFNPSAIAVDSKAGKLFWAASGPLPDRAWRIQRANLDGSDSEPIFIANRFGDEVFSDIAFVPAQRIEIDIDIKPGSDPNCFNINGHGVVPVAILGDAALDVTTVDVDSLLFGGLQVRQRKGRALCSVEDVNDDEYWDLVCKFEDMLENWVADEDEATLTGQLYDGTVVEGTDSICLAPKKPKKK